MSSVQTEMSSLVEGKVKPETDMRDHHASMIKHIESIIDGIPFLTDFLKSGARLYGGALRTIISKYMDDACQRPIVPTTHSESDRFATHSESDRVATHSESDRFATQSKGFADFLQYLRDGDIDLRYLPPRCRFFSVSPDTDPNEDIFRRIVRDGGFIEYQSGEYGLPVDSNYKQPIDCFNLREGLYFIWVPIQSSQSLAIHIPEQKFIRFEFLVLRDASSAKRDLDYNINNLQFGYNRETGKYWLDVIDRPYRYPYRDVDEVGEVVRDITNRKITIPIWGPTVNSLFNLKRLYRIKRLLESGYRLDFTENNIKRIQSVLEMGRQPRHGQLEDRDGLIEWDKENATQALKESREYQRKYPDDYVDPIVYPKLHTCSLQEPSLYDSEHIQTIKHPYTDFTLEFFLADETMQSLMSGGQLSP